MNSRFSNTVCDYLLRAGWHSGRNVIGDIALPSEYDLIPSAVGVLTEFGNLKIGQSERGVDCAKVHLEIQPYLATGMERRLRLFSSKLGHSLYPLGEVDGGHAYLVIDSVGRVFIMDDELTPVSYDFDRSLELLLTGHKEEEYILKRENMRKIDSAI